MKEKKEINIQIGARVKASREVAKLTQERFAELIDVSTQYVSDMERGKVGLSISTLRKICLTLSVSADYLLLGRQESCDCSRIEELIANMDPKYLPMLDNIVRCFIEAIAIANQTK